MKKNTVVELWEIRAKPVKKRFWEWEIQIRVWAGWDADSGAINELESFTLIPTPAKMVHSLPQGVVQSQIPAAHKECFKAGYQLAMRRGSKPATSWFCHWRSSISSINLCSFWVPKYQRECHLVFRCSNYHVALNPYSSKLIKTSIFLPFTTNKNRAFVRRG